MSQCKPSSARSMNGGAADDCPLQQLGKWVREYADIHRGTRLKKTHTKNQKRVRMAFGVCGMMSNPQCQVKEQVPNFAAEVHQLTNVGWACVGEDAQSLRLCEVGLPVSFYFKPTGDLFFFFARLSQSANKEAVFFFKTFIRKMHTHWCWIGAQSLNISTFFFCVQRIGHRRGAKRLNKLMLLGAVHDSVMRNGRFAQR